MSSAWVAGRPRPAWPSGPHDPELMRRYWRHQTAGPKAFPSDWKKGSTYAEQTLRVDWVDTELLSPGSLGITVCPGRRDRGRDLGADVARLRAEGPDRVLCLLTDIELNWAGVADLGTRLQAAGIDYRRLPVPDQGTPDVEDAGPWRTGAGRQPGGVSGSWSHAWVGWDAVGRSRLARW